MAVKEILDKRVIDLDMDAIDKDGVIRHLAGLLKAAGYVEDLEGYIRDVYLRESEGITGIGGHVAIPHGKSDYVDQVGIAVGEPERGLNGSPMTENLPNCFFYLRFHQTAKGLRII